MSDIQIEETLRQNIRELQQRLKDKTDAFMKHDLKQVTLIRKMENDIKEAYQKAGQEHPFTLLKSLYYRYIVKNKQTFE